MKYYSVKKGKKIGIYKTWEECQAQILNFKGAIYKSFSTWEEAEAWLHDKPKNVLKQKSETLIIDMNHAIAYSDGSFLKSNKTYSYGAVVLWNTREFHFSKRFDDSQETSMWNVSGELEGAKRAMLFAFANNIKHLTLYHDYEGIAKWAKGEWNAKNTEALEYISFCSKIKEKVNLKFIWVKGHSGDKYNDLADRLAAEADFQEMNKEV
ncbi:ribonuclease H [Entomoplasma ellychniae]|uniref:ribonuclease H n=1 Tax=Entomoplasma ellychniae TaxID=2114 RepID=A0A8E2QVG4_9MOLU|nr:ribonuclease H family protein [Entomoplasma ellychniae]PPE04422.1 ribonuclease H [Entomoplasma ellychniae]